MSDTATAMTTPETERDAYNRRIQQKRKKWNHLSGRERNEKIIGYAIDCPVPLDQLDLRPEELALVDAVKAEKEAWNREYEERQRQEKIAAEEKARKEREERKARIDAAEVKIKSLPADNLIPVNAEIFNTFAAKTKGVLLIIISLGRRMTVLSLDHEVHERRRENLPEPFHGAEEAVKAWVKTKFPETDVVGTVLIHVPTRLAALTYALQVPDTSTIEQLFDALAGYGINSVEIDFHFEDTSVCWDGMKLNGEDIDDYQFPGDEDHCLNAFMADAIGEYWREYAREARMGDTFRPRYAHAGDGSFFQDASGTVTFNILERKVDLDATATVERVVEEEMIGETWDVEKT